MGAGDLADGAVLPGEVAHGEVDGDDGRRAVHDAAAGGVVHFLAAVLGANLDAERASRFDAFWRQRVRFLYVRVQMLVLDGAGQAEVSAGAHHEVVHRAEDRRQQGRGGGQIDHRRPLRLVQQLARGGSRAVAVAVGQAPGLRDVLAAVGAGHGQDLA